MCFTFQSMVKIVASISIKRTTHVFVLGVIDTQAYIVFPKFYLQYVQFIETYNTRRPITHLVNNVNKSYLVNINLWWISHPFSWSLSLMVMMMKHVTNWQKSTINALMVKFEVCLISCFSLVCFVYGKKIVFCKF